MVDRMADWKADPSVEWKVERMVDRMADWKADPSVEMKVERMVCK
jgi:hypothetical protein